MHWLHALAVSLAVSSVWSGGASASLVQVGSRHVSVDGRSLSVTVVRAPLSKCRVKVALANNHVGATAPLATTAAREGALAAINGCFFDAYNESAVKRPWHNLMTGGRLVYRCNNGTILGFDDTGAYRMNQTALDLVGTCTDTDGRIQQWYPSEINRPPYSDCPPIVLDRHWTDATTPDLGFQVVVSGGRVTEVGEGSHRIPADGWVIVCGREDPNLAERFAVGAACEFHVVTRSDSDFWLRAREAIGCGPMLVAQGAIHCSPSSEGFHENKIVSMTARRSAVGVTKDGTLLLVTCRSATIHQMASVMLALGAYDAMNLDGGASCGLWAQGRYLTRPGRDLGSVLAVVAR